MPKRSSKNQKDEQELARHVLDAVAPAGRTQHVDGSLLLHEAAMQLGASDAANAHQFMSDVASRLAHRVQLTTDGNTTYLLAVADNCGDNIDYAQLVKMYGQSNEPETRYSPAKCLGAKKRYVTGIVAPEEVSTS